MAEAGVPLVDTGGLRSDGRGLLALLQIQMQDRMDRERYTKGCSDLHYFYMLLYLLGVLRG